MSIRLVDSVKTGACVELAVRVKLKPLRMSSKAPVTSKTLWESFVCFSSSVSL